MGALLFGGPHQVSKEIAMNETLQRNSESVFSRWVGVVLLTASKLDRVAMGMLWAALVLVLVWMEGLKFINYEADSIVPLVANSPMMRFLYHHPA
jgi:uncharacterized membrane protein YkgB